MLLGGKIHCFSQVKMEMAAVETMSHDQLISAMIGDVRSADLSEQLQVVDQHHRREDSSLSTSSDNDSNTSTDRSSSNTSTAL